jgi:hypothetical protein
MLALLVMLETSVHPETQATQEQMAQLEPVELVVQQEHLETQETQANKVALAAEGEAEALSIPP